MRSVSDAAKAGFEVQLRLDVQVLRQGRGPKFTLQFERNHVAFEPRMNFEAVAKDAGLEGVKGFGQLTFEFSHVGRHQAEQVARPKVNDGFQRIGKILDAEGLLSLLWQMGAGAKEPLQIAHHTLAIALEGDDPLRTTFLRIVRFIISQPIEQAGLKSFDNGKLRHESILLNRYRN